MSEIPNAQITREPVSGDQQVSPDSSTRLLRTPEEVRAARKTLVKPWPSRVAASLGELSKVGVRWASTFLVGGFENKPGPSLNKEFDSATNEVTSVLDDFFMRRKSRQDLSELMAERDAM